MTRRVSSLLLVLATLAAAGVVSLADDAPSAPAEIVHPTARTLVYGETTVCVDAPAGVELVLTRLIGPETWETIPRAEDGTFRFDAGDDLGPEILRLITYRRDADGFDRRVGDDVVETAFFLPPATTAHPEPDVSVLATPVALPGGMIVPLDAAMSADNFRCTFAGEPCRVKSVEPTEAGTLYVSLLVDVSGSMCPSLRELETSLHRLVTQLRASRHDVKVRLVEFNWRRRERLAPITGAIADRDRGLYAYEDDLEVLKQQVAKLSCDGSTSLWESVYRELLDMDLQRDAKRLREEPAEFALIVLSDGQNTSGAVGLGELMTVVSDVAVPVFPIMVGGPAPGLGTGFGALGARSGGRAYRAGFHIGDALEDIGRTLQKRYRLGFVPSPEVPWRRDERPLELANPYAAINHPSYWAPVDTRAEMARAVLESDASNVRDLIPALDAIRRHGSLRDAEKILDRFEDMLWQHSKLANVTIDPGWPLEDIESVLGLREQEIYLLYRARTFYAIFSACSRSLLHHPEDTRRHRRAARLLRDVAELIRGERYSLEHVMGPVIEAYLDPDFPSSESVEETLVGLRERPSSRAACPMKGRAPAEVAGR